MVLSFVHAQIPLVFPDVLFCARRVRTTIEGAYEKYNTTRITGTTGYGCARGLVYNVGRIIGTCRRISPTVSTGRASGYRHHHAF